MWELLITYSILNMKLVEFLAEPVRKKFPQLDMWWMQYVSLATGLVLGIVAGINVFPQLQSTAGIIVTSLLLGAGSGLIYDIKDLKPALR